MISDTKRKQLEAAGYTVSKSGKTVQSKSGGTVAGINEKGNLFGSANSKAFKILKGDQAKPKTAAKPKVKKETDESNANPATVRVATSDGSPRRQSNKPAEKYGTGSGPRTAAPKKRTTSDSPSAMTDSPSLSAPKSSGGAPINRSTSDMPIKAGYGSLANAKNRMESFKVSRQNKTINGVSLAEWKKLTRAERVEKNLPLTNQEFMRAMRLKGEDTAPVVSTSSKDTTDNARARATRTNRSRNSPDIPGMAKGGMVKKGTKDYKKSGMFYKSGSPRGYK